MNSEMGWLALDWGTSNLRLWHIGPSGEILWSANSDRGMGQLTSDQYPGVLAGLVPDTIKDASRIEVVVCGMAGARQGWLEAPYVDVPARLDRLGEKVARPTLPGSPFAVSILPGLCQRIEGSEDVMRGEETQLLGLSVQRPGFSGLVCMPGTHAKWVDLQDETVRRFSTAMTGELFSVLSKHSVLRHSLADPVDEPDRETGFAAGMTAGIEAPDRLTSLLFKTRSASLLSGRSNGWCAGYLSGLLIGAEVGGYRSWLTRSPVAVIGAGYLASLYVRALEHLGAQTDVIDASSATLDGLRAARKQIAHV